ncbi:MAG: VWA domain-containing protein [Myxococcales bacterium]|nr:VWA domain-containing protein [Myxococcales bacterium]
MRLSLLGVALTLAGCGGTSFSATDGFDYGEPGSGVPSDASTTGDDGLGQGSGEAALTAGAWDDNLNYDYFLDYLDDQGQVAGAPQLGVEERDVAFERFDGVREANVDLDLALLFDTTGSMADELQYLTNEIRSIAADIQAISPEASVRFSLVVYRDEGDQYITRTFAFTDDIGDFQSELATHSAEGGGDYPEASHSGLEDLLQLQWRSAADVARVAFWIADAPHHTTRAQALTESLREAATRDIHLYPVAASGTDQLAELAMRSAAQLTGGRYLFLTDDSGIGNSHSEPTIPCYFVTTLRDAMVRMVQMEYSGIYEEPAEEDVIRTGGDPENGACTLGDGTQVDIF